MLTIQTCCHYSLVLFWQVHAIPISIHHNHLFVPTISLANVSQDKEPRDLMGGMATQEPSTTISFKS